MRGREGLRARLVTVCQIQGLQRKKCPESFSVHFRLIVLYLHVVVMTMMVCEGEISVACFFFARAWTLCRSVSPMAEVTFECS